VDTFFGKDFYGNTYNPCKIIQEENIQKIIRFIWQNKMEKALKLMVMVKELAEFKALQKTYPDVIAEF
jgi:hypothetical protein